MLEDLGRNETANVLTTYTSMCYEWPPTFISRIRQFFEQLLHLGQLGVLMIGKCTFALVGNCSRLQSLQYFDFTVQ
jgi:hypothetical protein